jgi:hypothetical protein
MSNLLEKASILTTPTAYDDGKILSVKPTPSLGSELVTNGGFDTDSGWNKQTSNWIIINGYAVCDGLQTSNSSLFQDVAVINGKSYRIDFTITNSVNNLNLILGATTIGQYGSGTHSIYVTKDSNASARIFFQATASNAFQGSLDNVSVKELIDGDFDFTRNSSATRVNAQGLIEDVASGLPRIDYTDGVGSWLFEPQSTNLVTYSEDFSQWGQSGAPTLTSGQLAPDGTFGATKISGTIGSSYIALANSSTTTSTRTIYAKTVSGTGTAKLMSFSSNTNNLFTLTEEWQRFELTGSSATGGNSFYIDLRDNAQTLSEFIIWGAQSEELSFATSIIPTNGSTVTRLADAAFGAGSSDLINSTEGVLYAEIAALSDDLTNKQISLNNGTTDDRIQLYYSSSSNQISVFYKSQSGATAFILNHTLSDITQFNKVAFKWKQNDFALWSNGVEVATQTSGVTSIANTLTKLDFTQFNGSADFFGKTKCLAVFKEALTDEELTCLTTI